MLRWKSIIIISILLIPAAVFAKPRKGFHEGPYLNIIGGLISATFDKNDRTGEKTGGDYHGNYGFDFGWNLWDTTAAELEVRYMTTKATGNREHIVNINTNIKYAFIFDALTNIKGSLHILPFVKGGPSAIIAAVPGDPLANYSLMTVWGVGVGGSIGADFMVKRYIYFGFLVQGDMHHIHPVYQNIGGANTKIIKGGWSPQLGVLGSVGVHF